MKIFNDTPKGKSVKFIVLLGIVSLFADMTYEGARSVIGPYLLTLGANAAIVGTVAGFGELVSYTFRYFSGYLSDRTGKYWFFATLGYVINLFAVPLLALAGSWQTAASLVIMERFGKSVRSPSKDAMLSYASKEVGRGWGFGLHESLDQIGAILGPLFVMLALYYHASYQMSFTLLIIPAFFALSFLAFAYWMFPNPKDLEIRSKEIHMQGFSKPFWIYAGAVSLVAAGYVDFPIIAYHIQKDSHISTIWIPLFYSVAMATDGIGAFLLGRLFDKKGLSILIITTMISVVFAPLIFLGNNFYTILLGCFIWGVGLGVQKSIMRAYVAELVGVDKRGSAYGIINTCYGLSWFIGSALMGFLYDISLIYLVIFSVSLQLLAIPLIFLCKRK
ncbi:MAG: MFS transporter [Parachlamydiaceae bacterium]|nr:MFS transporter [Parachlamydiaceae bacterium]